VSVEFSRTYGLFVIFRHATDQRRAIGFKIKSRRQMLFSERNGLSRGVCIGPLYFGLFS
jgi:hypothetical protein